ncbi:LytTR family transcriptional regulator DNA-binding domain-containing protein [Lactiplantibacillus paraplantarum]|uniref:DNA-binding response regulator n=1 Tax=Lactiplantibacillus paraplantarum TaxID=60520 RepID=I6TUT6_9LACO|nr:LytTR family transcriptional regulator DNA-binding domain-containing protein [Lactiplantibacillus paraplantarum]AFM80181.1 response regulator PlnC [Lactiplantibacillus paraplantarum]AYJ37632.1 DNA-binding response regulator [Lactiplantibacillus paraplantarum]ERL43678.1 PlnC [Lactiplantibacillus paraplantarum]MCU4682582.1 LytTR family transcriptional regulator DNA-binding domain-containing protein [Lactiplantibacillus paraplantarum]MDL2060655.1 LytTR family transcriptional regulator DNA-bind
MFPIYLLEDDEAQRVEYISIIKNIIMIKEYDMQLVVATGDLQELMNNIVNSKEGLFFLDMEIGEQTQAGLNLADEIRQQLPFAQIVFITTHEELSFLTLERRIAPLDYILKEQGLDDIKQKIVKDIDATQTILKTETVQHKDILGYKIGTRFFSVPINDVIMLSTNKERPGSIRLTAKNKVADFPGNLNSFENKYSQFFRCDKSALVNVDYIDSYDYQKKELTMIDNIKCSVSYRKSRELNKILKKK